MKKANKKRLLAELISAWQKLNKTQKRELLFFATELINFNELKPHKPLIHHPEELGMKTF